MKEVEAPTSVTVYVYFFILAIPFLPISCCQNCLLLNVEKNKNMNYKTRLNVDVLLHFWHFCFIYVECYSLIPFYLC